MLKEDLTIWRKILRIKIGCSEYSLYGFLTQPLEDFWKDYVCWRHIKKYGHIFKEVCDKIGLETEIKVGSEIVFGKTPHGLKALVKMYHY